MSEKGNMREGPQISWRDYQLFIEVARYGGLSPASNSTGSSPATLSRRMLVLEEALSMELFFRHDRGYALTENGQRLLLKLSEVERQMARLASAPQEHQLPIVKISAGSWTSMKLAWLSEKIVGTPPQIRLRLLSTEDVLSIDHREVTIGFRNQAPDQDHLVAKKLPVVEFLPYATADAPDQWIKVLGETHSARWQAQNLTHNVVFEVGAPRQALDFVLKGQGKAILPKFIGERFSELQPMGDAIEELKQDQWLVTHSEDRYIPAIRQTIDRITALF